MEGRLSSLSKRREMDAISGPELDNKIDAIRSQLDKEVHDATLLIQQKHVEFLPQTMFLNVQFSIEQTITKAESALKELAHVAEDVDRQLGDIKESPRQKLDNINSILKKLYYIKELENLYEEINSDNVSAPIELATTIKKCDDYLHSLSDKQHVYEPLQKILPGLIQTFAIRRGDIYRRFNNKFLDMIQYPSNNGKSNLQLSISRANVEQFNLELTAMHLLGTLDEQLNHFSDEVLNIFVARILDSRSPHDNILTFETFPDSYSIMIKKNVTKAEKIEPLRIIETLKAFFINLHHALQEFKVNEIPLVKLFGEMFSTKLIEMVIKDCLTASVPYDESEKAGYQAVIDSANNFHEVMQNLGFFESKTLTFEAFAEKFDQIFVNRRCTRIIFAARNHICDHSVDTVEVGATENEGDDLPEQFIKDFEKNSQIRATDFPKNPHLPKLFQLNKCKISKSVYELGELLVNTMEAASLAEKDFAAGRLLTTAHNIVKLYLMSAEKQHHEMITTVPMVGGLFYNGCYYLCHLIMMESFRLQSKVTKKWPALIKDCNFTMYFAELRQQAANALEHHLLQVRRQVSSVVVVDDLFLNLRVDSVLKECRRVVEGCIKQIQQISSIWKDVLADAVYVRAIGSLVSYTLSVFTKMVLQKEDITEVDAKEIEQELTSILKAFESLMKVNGQQTIQAVCEADYHKTKEIIYCLRESLANISDRWCEGKGPLAHWLRADQVKQLIRALFQNTDRRAHVLENIN